MASELLKKLQSIRHHVMQFEPLNRQWLTDELNAAIDLAIECRPDKYRSDCPMCCDANGNLLLANMWIPHHHTERK